MTDINQMIAEFETRRAALAAYLASGSIEGFAVKCGPLCIRFSDDRKTTNACGVELSTRFASRITAEQLASRVTNGNGTRGRVVSFYAAVTEELASLDQSLQALRGALAAQA
jgi:hypothetical protein